MPTRPDQIRRCPMCSGVAELRDAARGTQNWVECQTLDCHAMGPNRGTPEDALTGWNRRADFGIPPGGGEACNRGVAGCTFYHVCDQGHETHSVVTHIPGEPAPPELMERPWKKYGTELRKLAEDIVNGVDECETGGDRILATETRIWNAFFGYQATIPFPRLKASAEATCERIKTVADEAFGPFPVQTAEEAVSCIEQGIYDLRLELGRARRSLAETSAAPVRDWVGKHKACVCGKHEIRFCGRCMDPERCRRAHGCVDAGEGPGEDAPSATPREPGGGAGEIGIAHAKYVEARDEMQAHERNCYWCSPMRGGVALGCGIGRLLYEKTREALRNRNACPPAAVTGAGVGKGET